MNHLVEKELAGQSDSKIEISGSIFRRKMVMSGVPQGPVLVPVLFKIFVGGTECTFSKFFSNTKMCGAITILNGRDVPSRGTCTCLRAGPVQTS